LCAAVTPVLPSLCDLSALQLVLPCTEGEVEGDLPLRGAWWGLAFADGDEYLQLAVSTLKSDGRYYLTEYDRGDDDMGFDLPFDIDGRYGPNEPIVRFVGDFSQDISGPHRPRELDQRVVNAVVRGAKKAFKSKKAVHTARKYLKQYTAGKYLKRYPVQSVSVRHVAKDIQYVSTVFALQSWVDFRHFAPRLVAQRRLQKCLKKSSNGFLKELETQDVSVLGAALCDALQWGEPTDDCESLAETVFSYSGIVSSI